MHVDTVLEEGLCDEVFEWTESTSRYWKGCFGVVAVFIGAEKSSG